MSSEIKTTSLVDILIASVSTIFFIGALFLVRYILGMEVDINELWEQEKDIIYPIAGVFILAYIIMIENITRWTKILLRKLGQRTYNRKHVDGFPINEQDVGYKLIDADATISKTSREIQENNDLDLWMESVWYANMELRHKDYIQAIRKSRKKCKKIKDKTARTKIFDDIKLDMGVASDMLKGVTTYDKELVETSDTKLDEKYDISPLEYNELELLENEYDSGLDNKLDKIRNNIIYVVFVNYLIPIVFAVVGIVLIRKYTISEKGGLDGDDLFLFNMAIGYLAIRIPTVIINAVRDFKRNMRNKLEIAFAFKRYNNRKAKLDNNNE